MFWMIAPSELTLLYGHNRDAAATLQNGILDLVEAFQPLRLPRRLEDLRLVDARFVQPLFMVRSRPLPCLIFLPPHQRAAERRTRQRSQNPVHMYLLHSQPDPRYSRENC